jgi:hypothetical protein
VSIPPPRPAPGLCLEARRKLSGPVINVYMTLMSVLLGVLLFPLMESATPLVRTLRFEYWPYILGSLLLIMWIWTNVITHALTFVGWPVDMGHYLPYIAGALLIGIQMHFLADPIAWWGLLVAELAGILAIYLYDLQLMRRRMSQAKGTEATLLAATERRQVRGLRLTALSLVIAFIGAVLLLLAPATLLGGQLHVVLGLAWVGWLLFWLADSIRSFNPLRELVLINAAAELCKEEEDISRVRDEVEQNTGVHQSRL